MGTLRALTGQYLNNLERATLSSTSANALYPLTRLQINRLSKDFRFNAAGVDDSITADQNIIVNPTVSTWAAGLPSGYTKAGTVAETTVGGEVRTGSAAKVTGDLSYLEQRVVVRAGQALKLDIWARVSATGTPAASVQVINEETGLYLQSGGGTWGSPVAAVSTTSTSYVPLAVTFGVQSYSDCGDKDTVTLILRFVGSGDAAQFAFFDDLTLYPGFDFMACCGHTFSKLIAPQLRGSTDNFAASDVNLSPAIGQYAPAHFYFGLSSVQYYRYVRVKFVGTNPTAGQIGKLIIGQMQTLLQHYEAPYFWSKAIDRQTSRSPSGERFGHKRTLFPQRRVTFSYVYWEQAQIDDAFDCWDRAEGDTFPVLIVPDTERPEVVFGYLPNQQAWSRELVSLYDDYELPVDEAPSAPTGT